MLILPPKNCLLQCKYMTCHFCLFLL
uniref:Uncharacterized protein n=1 Tax=Arundo donax TaxID=35708 RepID=A0A0A9HQL0_ARUDO